MPSASSSLPRPPAANRSDITLVEPSQAWFRHGRSNPASSDLEFTYSIEDIARYYRTYLDLMRHWDAVLPGRVLRVLYEDVVLKNGLGDALIRYRE